jgi:hypothetical protein
MFIPHGWRTEGGVYWASDFLCVNGYNFIWSATSPDGALSMGVTPQAGWAYASGGPPSPQPGCPVLPLASTRQYLEHAIKTSVHGAVMLDYRDRPELVRQIGVQPQRTAMPMGELQAWAEGGELLFAFRKNGADMRGSMAAVVQFNKLITNTSSIYGDGARIESVTAFAHPGFAVSAPNGRLNLAFFEALRKTMRANPSWAQRISGHNTRIARVAIEESRKRAEMTMQANDEIARIRQETWNAQQESADRRAREFGEAIRGVESWTDSSAPGGPIELSQTNYAWRLNDGSYVMTDDPNFDPWRDLRVEGRQLEAVQ